MNRTLLLFIFSGIVTLFYAIKKLRLRYTVLSALSGLASFFAVDWICSFFESDIPLNAFSLSVCAIGGIPGLILLILLHTFL